MEKPSQNNINESPSSSPSKPSDAETVKLFMDIFRAKFNSAANEGRLQKAYGDGTAHEFDAEKKLIRELNAPGVKWGIGAAVMSFLALRRAPVYLAQRYYRSKTSFGSFMPPRPGIFRYSLGLTFDLFLSMWMGASVTMFLTDKEKMQKGLAKMPLLQGRSIIAEELCSDYIRAYQMAESKGFDWKAPHNEYPSIDAITTFVLNCKKRAVYEKRLRRETGKPANEPLSIPSPGVPDDILAEESFDDEQVGTLTSNYDYSDAPYSFNEDNSTGFDSEESNDSGKDEVGNELSQWKSIDDFEKGQQDGDNSGTKKRGWWG